jgi:hypothetical protein
MKSKFLVLAMATVIVALSGCANSQDNKQAMQKNYQTADACQKDFPQANDCTRYTTSTGGYGYHSPFFYPWGGIYHSNGVMSYNNRVPTSGYVAAPVSVSSRISSTRGFTAPRASFGGASTRGGFGSTGRGFGGSFGG